MYGVGFGIGAIGATTILKSAGGAIDADAQSFFTATGITDLTQKNAVNQLVLDLKSNNLWTKMKALYPIVGGNATAHSYNLINTSLYQLSFSTGWTHSSTGMKPNGTSAYANTGINPYSISIVNNTHIAIYSRTSTVTNAQRDFGAFQDNYNPCISLGTNSSSFISDAYNYDNNRITATISDALGLYVGTRTSNVVFKLFKNGSQIGSTNTNTYSGLLPNLDLYLGSANIGGNIGGPSDKQYSYASYGVGLNDSEVSVLNTCIQSFQTSLSRNV